MSQGVSSEQALNQMIGGYWVTQAIYVAAELGIADHLAAKTQTVEELAGETRSDAASLYRVLRALSSVGIFAEDGDRRFSLTPLAERLRSDVPGSQRSFAIMMGAELYQSWGNLAHTVKEGEEAFSKTYGVPFFDYMTKRPERHAIYDRAMNGVHGPETEPMLDAYDFSRFGSVMDVGGGNGLTLAAVLKRHPAVRGILFDLPGVADRALAYLAEEGLDDRCEVVGGSFFSSVPAADAYILRHVIHDWQDEESITILGNCQKAMNPDGRVLVVESVIPPGNVPSFGKWLDLMMLVVGGRERTEGQYRELFARAGLRLNRIVSTAHEVSVIEGVRAD